MCATPARPCHGDRIEFRGVQLAGLRALVDDVAVGGLSGAYVLVHAGVGYAF